MKTIEQIKFPVGYHEFSKDKAFNFQLNRWYSMGYARLEDVLTVGNKIHTFDDWNKEMISLADLAASENRLLHAAFYYRAAELFITEKDPEKEILYNKFIEYFYKAVKDTELKTVEIPYKQTSIQAIQLQPASKEKKGTIIIHGGFDSFKEELYSMMLFFLDSNYEVITFETPWMGESRKRKLMGLEIEWEKPIKAVLDHFKLEDVTLIGISMGGWLSLRAAAFEPRVKRVIASSVSFDVNQYNNIVGQKLAKLFFRKLRGFTNKAIIKKMKKDLYYSWFMNHLMFVTNKDVPIEALDVLVQFSEENLHSDLIKQDVLILTGRKDHMVPFKMHELQVKALSNARSVTARVFKKEESAHNHCQIGNVGLALNTMLEWIEKDFYCADEFGASYVLLHRNNRYSYGSICN
jgi:pimeloyl-ACP methyl ester carboxylesterase